MGLATIDSHSQREHTEIDKIPKFGVNQLVFTEIQPFENAKIYKETSIYPFNKPEEGWCWPAEILQQRLCSPCLDQPLQYIFYF